jgi:hypothetical protein
MSELNKFAAQTLPYLDQEMRAVLQTDGAPILSTKPLSGPATTPSGPLVHADPAPLFGMLQYHMGWLDQNFAPDKHYAGKRIRPLLVLLACQAAGGIGNKPYLPRRPSKSCTTSH